MDVESSIKAKYEVMEPQLDERRRRLWAATEARAIGRGGITIVSRATGLSRDTIYAGFGELGGGCGVEGLEDPQRVRRPGAGRKSAESLDASLVTDLERLLEPTTRGDPESPLRWTCKSTRTLAEELRGMGHRASHVTVAELLHKLEYSLQANLKTIEEGSQHPDRNEQFERINGEVQRQLAEGNPAISVDAKKKELVGPFKNAGREWRPKGSPEKVRGHDFEDKDLGHARPYGVYDLKRNEGWVSVGVDHDTATFAIETVRRWWYSMGRDAYPTASSLLITADGGGSNGSRLRLWKTELQGLANELGFPISVCHFPPGTSKWNKIEHRMFAQISQNWRGRPLSSREVIVNLIAATTTKNGLNIKSEVDANLYPTGRQISKAELKKVNMERAEFHGEWNYTVSPLTGQNV
jgi:hypothetical protein